MTRSVSGSGRSMSGILLSMRSEEFVAQRRDDWNRLEDLLARAGAGRLNSLAPAQVLTMAALYRRATADRARLPEGGAPRAPPSSPRAARAWLAGRASAPLPQRACRARPQRRVSPG